MDWRTHLHARLQALQPRSLSVLDADARMLASIALPDLSDRVQDGAPAAPCALALGVAALDGLDAGAARHLIHRARLYAAPRLLLVARADCTLDDDAFRALGFMRELLDPADGTRIQSYDLATYKPVPDWLNARFWAHPERWVP
ncbi:MAG: DUF6231 family protein [Pseudomonadota bacterium]